MEPSEHIARAVADRRSGSVAVAARAARGLAPLTTKADVLKASRKLLRAHPAMAALWHLCSVAHDADDRAGEVTEWVEALHRNQEAAADGIRWVVGRRKQVVIVHSASAGVRRALNVIATRVSLVLCTTSLPGGEGRAFARALERDGIATEVIADSAIALGCARADLALVGADAITEDAVVNKVGTHPLALAAADAGIGLTVVAGTDKFLPASFSPEQADGYEGAPLRAFDAVLTEKGPRRLAAVRRAVGRIELPAAIAKIAP